MSAEADHVAREIANKAVSLIEGHEKVCAERQQNIHDSITGLSGSIATVQRGVERINSRFWAAAITIISMLLSVIGALLYVLIQHQP